MSCPHPTYTIEEEPAQGGTNLVSKCSKCGAVLSKTFIPAELR